jgi:hypothetical protein
MDEAGAVRTLVERLPEFAPIADEHVAFNGELLLHVLMGDLGRFYMEHAVNEPLLAERYWRVVEELVATGDERVENAVAASLIEWFVWGDAKERAAIRAAAPMIGPATRRAGQVLLDQL